MTTESAMTPADLIACENTDRELWREREGDYYADSIHVTQGGSIGMNCGGHVIVQPIRKWHEAASALEQQARRIAALEAAVRQWASECAECNGTGVHQIATDCIGGDIFPVTEPCPDCADIRNVLQEPQG